MNMDFYYMAYESQRNKISVWSNDMGFRFSRWKAGHIFSLKQAPDQMVTSILDKCMLHSRFHCHQWLVHKALQWHHNGRGGISTHQYHHCLLNRLFRCRSKITSKLRVTGLCAGNSPVTGEFPAQIASYAENVSIWWRHHGITMLMHPVYVKFESHPQLQWLYQCAHHLTMHSRWYPIHIIVLVNSLRPSDAYLHQ